MKKLLHMVLIVGLLVSLGALLQGCMMFGGHGDDSDPYEAGLGGGLDWDALDEGPAEFSSVGKLTEATITGMSEDILFTTFDIASSMDLNLGREEVNNTKYLSTSSIGFDNIFLNVGDDVGGVVSIRGRGAFVKNRPQRCVLFANITNNYLSYSYPTKASDYAEEAIMTGNNEIRLIATSRACHFTSDMNLSVKMVGNIAVNGIIIKSLEFSAEHQSMSDTIITVKSSVVSTPEGTLYCRTYNTGGVFCTTIDHSDREFEDMTTCSDGVNSVVRRECDLSTDEYLTTHWLYGNMLVPYEVHLKCSDSGIWTPPCMVNSSFDVCPYDSVCRASDDINWGPGLEGYGYCSCD